MTILLIDDDEDDQDIFKEAACLVRPDVQFLSARDGEQALALLETLSSPPDYIFLDVNMPRMDGKEFLKHMKAKPENKAIPVVIYSTSNHKSEFGEFFGLGAAAFITKPSEYNLLITYLKSLLVK